MKFLKTLAAIDTEVAFRWNQTLYRTKNSKRCACQESRATCIHAREAHDNKRVWGLFARPSRVINSGKPPSFKMEQGFLKFHLYQA
jgi:hypothetical protein